MYRSFHCTLMTEDSKCGIQKSRFAASQHGLFTPHMHIIHVGRLFTTMLEFLCLSCFLNRQNRIMLMQKCIYPIQGLLLTHRHTVCMSTHRTASCTIASRSLNPHCNTVRGFSECVYSAAWPVIMK